jgi:hypothetical protein
MTRHGDANTEIDRTVTGAIKFGDGSLVEIKGIRHHFRLQKW